MVQRKRHILYKTCSPGWLDRREAVDWLQRHGVRISYATLKTFASRGNGPEFHKDGRKVIYHSDDLVRWVRQRLKTPKPRNSQ